MTVNLSLTEAEANVLFATLGVVADNTQSGAIDYIYGELGAAGITGEGVQVSFETVTDESFDDPDVVETTTVLLVEDN